MKILQTCPLHLSDVATLPWELQKVIFSSIIHTYFWLFMLSEKKTDCNPLAHPTCKCHYTNLWIANLFHCCVLSNVGVSEKSQLWVVVRGTEKNRLWCVATGMSGKQRYSNCSAWPASALIHASSLFRHWSVAEVQPMLQQAAAATYLYQYTRSSCSVLRYAVLGLRR